MIVELDGVKLLFIIGVDDDDDYYGYGYGVVEKGDGDYYYGIYNMYLWLFLEIVWFLVVVIYDKLLEFMLQS